MARVYQAHGYELREVQSPGGRLRMTFVPELGGMGVSLICKTAQEERELLWLPDEFWKVEPTRRYGGWPILFPICARLERDGIPECYLYRGRRYQMPIHGFASRIPWRVEVEGEHSLRLVLTDNEETRSQFPFSFEVELDYSVSDEEVVCVQRYRNTGDQPMPYYAGFHPYFATPRSGEGKEACQVELHPTCRYVYNSRLTDTVGTAEAMKFPIPITEPGINEQLYRMRPGELHAVLTLDDGCRITVETSGGDDDGMFPFIQLFTRPELPFFCIEPWMGAPNTLNAVEGSRWLRPGEEECGQLRVRVETPSAG